MARLPAFLRDLAQLVRAHGNASQPLPYDELREREAHYRSLAESAGDVIWRLEFPGNITYVSPACEPLLGWTPEEQRLRAGDGSMLTPESAAVFEQLQRDALARGLPGYRLDAEHRRRDGSTVWCEVRVSIQYDEAGRPVGSVGVTRDISQRRRLEQQIRRTQKLEALGTLAAGVAHDFNNYLTVVMGYLEVLEARVPEGGPAAKAVEEAQQAVESASTLARDLLAFGRGDPPKLRVLDLNHLVARSGPLLRRAVGDGTRLEIQLARNLGAVRADPVRLEQALFNLVLNARDAVGERGEIRIETRRAEPDDGEAGPRAGRFAVLRVSDDGCGMPSEVRERVFEPFFSTRAGHSGLGLATVQAIAGECGGEVRLHSEPGVGTRVELRLPDPAEASGGA